jgi:hypothetical protein
LDRGDGAVTGVILRFWGSPDRFEEIHGTLQRESSESQARYPSTHDLDKYIHVKKLTDTFDTYVHKYRYTYVSTNIHTIYITYT